jgi:hypothetical protein
MNKSRHVCARRRDGEAAGERGRPGWYATGPALSSSHFHLPWPVQKTAAGAGERLERDQSQFGLPLLLSRRAAEGGGVYCLKLHSREARDAASLGAKQGEA